MLRFFVLAFVSVLIVSVGYFVLPRGSRPDTHLDAQSVAPPDPSTFVVHEAPDAAPVPAPPAAPSLPRLIKPAPPAAPPQLTSAEPNTASGPDLDTVLQRLRSNPPAPATTPTLPPPPAPIPQPPAAPAVIVPSPPPGVLVAPPSRWTSVTGQGARWRMAPGASGYTISIDLGGGRVADVHVAPAFANLDPAAMNQRVDYLKTTILQNFPPESASYTFARDGSVSLDP